MTGHSLKVHKSSALPPPLPTINTSNFLLNLFAIFIFVMISSVAPSPCTRVGNIYIFAILYRRFILVIKSRIASPVAAVIIPILLGIFGRCFLFSSLLQPLFLRSSKRF